MQRRHLRSDVTAEVQERLLSGQLPVGRINESELALDLGISRTPLREALLVMEQRGLVDSLMGRGFLVRELSLEEAEEIYSLLGVLEPMAVRAGAAALQARGPALQELLARMCAASDLSALQALGREWGDHIIQACPNRKLASLLTDLYRLSARYERRNIESIGDPAGFDLSMALARQRRIVDALAVGDSDTASQLLGAGWGECLAALRLNLPAKAGERRRETP